MQNTLYFGDNLNILRGYIPSAGFYTSQIWNKDYPRLQILTVDGLLHGAQRLQMPPQSQTAVTFKQVQKGKEKAKIDAHQPGLGLE